MAPHDSANLARHGARLEIIGIVCLTLAWAFIALRVWTRTYIKPNFGWDDFTMVLAGVIFTAFCGCILYIEANGGGTHVSSVDQLSDLTKKVIASEAAYVATVMVLKISLGIFFARIVVRRWHLIVIQATVAISCVSATSTFFYCLFRCGNNLDNYVLRQLAHQCTPQGLDRFFAYQHAAFAFTTDCVFVLLPIPLLWNSQMSRRSKIIIGLILSFAALGCVCSAIRFKYVDGLTQVDDFFWNAVNVSIWSTIEPGVGIMAGSMVTLGPLLKCVLRKFRLIHSMGLRPSRRIRSSESCTPATSREGEAHADSKDTPLSQMREGQYVRAEMQQRQLDASIQNNVSKRDSTEHILAQTDSRSSNQHGEGHGLSRTHTWASRRKQQVPCHALESVDCAEDNKGEDNV